MRVVGQRVSQCTDRSRCVTLQALQHLEMQLINVACDDPGAAIGANMALPLLQERLDVCARKHAEEKALLAQEALFHTEVSPISPLSRVSSRPPCPQCPSCGRVQRYAL